jgi:preprotein translocase subunit SecD
MKKKNLWKAVIILGVAGLCAAAIYPPQRKIKLGLDLKGGIHLIMKVHMEDAFNVVADEAVEVLSEALADANLTHQEVVKQSPTRVVARGVDINQESEFRKLAQQRLPAWEPLRLEAGLWQFDLRPLEQNRVREETLTQAVETIRRRVDAFGVEEPLIAPHGDQGDQILVQLPGFDDVARAKNIIRSTAKLELKLVEDGPAGSTEQLLAGRPAPPPGTEILPGVPFQGSEPVYWLVQKTPVITGRDLKNARQSIDYETNFPNVSFTLKAEAAGKFGRATAANIGRNLAIILDERVESAPTIQSRITDQGQITGRYSLEEAQDLALKLRSGALPASLEYQEERTVGPSLGADSIRSGVAASLIGLALVVFFMLIYYRLAGINAVVALALNLVILMGAMALIPATLTLPGIAGVILTIGMGVDSNVLIFERIKEEMRGGKTPRTAISAGFSKVFWTIFDTHVTSLVAAAILGGFGTGPVQGFAVTLAIGLIANIFTSIFVSRFVFDLMLGSRQVQTLSI